ncbi:hypothetical protein HCJ39_06910 [Listeria rocourtiae]|uniref:hypothetical protein n=1 Tax=Listeria rocourtiae TaxID=647910 RepID=UPI001627F749|nr:hypothetical protein [Listeria rocourtiae]MBC1604440.1 hypothetical protein [Listeria rocourtiae]
MSIAFILVGNKKGATGKTILSQAIVGRLEKDKQVVSYLEGQGAMDDVIARQSNYVVYDQPTGESDRLLLSEPAFSTIIFPTSLNQAAFATLREFVDEVMCIKAENPTWDKTVVIALTQPRDTPFASAIFEKMQEKLMVLDAHIIDVSIAVNDAEKRQLEPLQLQQLLLTRLSEEREEELKQLLTLIEA